MVNAKKPEISVILPCKNHSKELRDCLTGLDKMTVHVPFEVIVIDSASDPKVLDVACRFPEVKLIRSEKNLNAAEARNLAARHARGYFFAFIDADCIPGHRWLQTAYDGLNKGMKMVGGPVSDAVPFRGVPSADNILQFADLPANRPEEKIELMPSCNLGVTKEAFEKTGGFPAANNMHEDVIFTAKIASLWPDKCKFLPEMLVFHKGRQSLSELWNHHHHFGYGRGVQGFRITKKQQHFGRFLFFVPFVMFKRLTYIFKTIIRWNREKAGIYFALLPLIIFGLTGYAVGFQRGCQSAYKNKKAK